MSFPCVICYNDVRPRQHALECDSCQSWQHQTCGSGVTVLEYRNWTDDQEYICSVCRDAGPEPTERNEIKVLLMDNVHGGNVHHIYADTELLSARLLIILSMARYSRTFIFSLFSYQW
jgi:hypothetical protein